MATARRQLSSFIDMEFICGKHNGRAFRHQTTGDLWYGSKIGAIMLLVLDDLTLYNNVAVTLHRE